MFIRGFYGRVLKLIRTAVDGSRLGHLPKNQFVNARKVNVL